MRKLAAALLLAPTLLLAQDGGEEGMVTLADGGAEEAGDCETQLETLRARVAELEATLQGRGEDLTAEGEPEPAPELAGWGVTRWQMPREEVQPLLPGAQRTAAGGLTLARTVAGKPARVELSFTGEGLSQAAIRFFPLATQAPRVEDYTEVRRLLTDKYGPPQEDTITGASAAPRSAEGRVQLESVWRLGPTRIELALLPQGGRPVLELLYTRAEDTASAEQRDEALLEGL